MKYIAEYWHILQSSTAELCVQIKFVCTLMVYAGKHAYAHNKLCGIANSSYIVIIVTALQSLPISHLDVLQCGDSIIKHVCH